MVNINVSLSDEAYEKLCLDAEVLGTTAHELSSRILEEYLRERSFRAIVEATLSKNAELYRRLARGPR